MRALARRSTHRGSICPRKELTSMASRNVHTSGERARAGEASSARRYESSAIMRSAKSSHSWEKSSFGGSGGRSVHWRTSNSWNR